MFSWIDNYVGRFARTVASEVRSLVGTLVHAVTGVIYTVFGNVGAAWDQVLTEAHNVWQFSSQFADWVWRWFHQLITVDIPYLWSWSLAQVRQLGTDAVNLYNKGVAFTQRVYTDVLLRIAAGLQWVITAVWDPLKSYADQIYKDLLKWGYTAWYYITHPDQLASLLLGYLIAAAENTFFTIAGPAGRFILGVLLHQSQKFIALLEEIIAAVL
jgi:hypothetical protein